MRTKTIVGAVVLVAMAGVAEAQPAVQATAPAPAAERHHSVNGNPMGILFGAYGLNYEYLGGSHGLVVEAAYARSGGDTASATTYGGGAGWRWHWRGRQNSGFLGVMASFSGGTARATVSGDMPETFDLSLKQLSVTMNVGKRWQLDSGLNITARLGAGRAKRWFSTTSTDPDAQEAVESVEDVMDLIPIALDGELSLGYSF